MELEELRKVIKELPEKETKSLLFHIFLKVNQLEETEYSIDEFAKDVKEMYGAVSDYKNEMSENIQKETPKRVHILFGPSSAGCLKIVLKDLKVDKEERIISFWDMFSVGPIWKLHDENGNELRVDWLKRSHNYSLEELEEYKQGFQKTLYEIKGIPEGTPITIWSAENSHEETGLRYVLYLLKGRNNKINVINNTKIYARHFDQPEIKYIMLHSGEISPEKLKVIYKCEQNQPLSEQEREQLELDWLGLADNHESLRIWQNGEIQSVPEDHYDLYMINMAKKLLRRLKSEEYMKSARLIGEALGHLEQYVGDEFLEYRLRMLIEKGVFEFEGSLEAMRFYSIRLRK